MKVIFRNEVTNKVEKNLFGTFHLLQRLYADANEEEKRQLPVAGLKLIEANAIACGLKNIKEKVN